MTSATLNRQKDKLREKELANNKRLQLKQDRMVKNAMKQVEKTKSNEMREWTIFEKKAKRVIDLQDRIGKKKAVKYRDKDEEKLGKVVENFWASKHGFRINELKKALEVLEKEDRELKRKEDAIGRKKRYPMEDTELVDRDESLVARPPLVKPAIDGIPIQYAGKVLALWDFVEKFHEAINISRITLSELRLALLYTEPVPLLTDLHVQLLSVLLIDREAPDYTSEDEDEGHDDDKWIASIKSTPLVLGPPQTFLLNRLTWPSVISTLIMSIPRYLHSASPVLVSAIDELEKTSYPTLSVERKIELLTFLMNKAFMTTTIRKVLKANLTLRIEKTRIFNRAEATERRETLDAEKQAKDELRRVKDLEANRHKTLMVDWLNGGKVGPKPSMEEANTIGAPNSDVELLESDSDESENFEDEPDASFMNSSAHEAYVQRKSSKLQRIADKKRRKEEQERKRRWNEMQKHKRRDLIEEFRRAAEDKDIQALDNAIALAPELGLATGRGQRLWQSEELREAIEMRKRLITEAEKEAAAIERREQFERDTVNLFVRTNSLGMDASCFRYWLFSSDTSTIYIERSIKRPMKIAEPVAQTALERSNPRNFCSHWYRYDTIDELNLFVSSLDVRGIREEQLKNSIMLNYNAIYHAMENNQNRQSSDENSFLQWRNFSSTQNTDSKEISVNSVQKLLLDSESWLADRLQEKGSEWCTSDKLHGAYVNIVQNATCGKDLARALLLLEEEIYIRTSKEPVNGKTQDAKDSSGTSSSPILIAQQGDESVDESVEDEDEEQIVDDGTVLWPSNQCRERWRSAVFRICSLSSIAIALTTLVARCEVIGIVEVLVVKGNNKPKIEVEKRQLGQRNAKKKVEPHDRKTYDSYSSDEWEEYCYVCSGTGEVLCCDGCPKVFHFSCLNLSRKPRGKTYCLECKPLPKAESADSNQVIEDDPEYNIEEDEDTGDEDDDDPWDTICDVCDKDGKLLCCDGCPKAYHPECIELDDFPKGDWFCRECETQTCGQCGLGNIKLDSHVICGSEDRKKGCDRVFHLVRDYFYTDIFNDFCSIVPSWMRCRKTTGFADRAEGF